MIRVLHVGLSSNNGGIENVVRQWMLYKPEDIHFDFINVEERPLAYMNEFEKLGAVIYDVAPRHKNPWKSAKQLRQIITQGNYDFVHCHIMSFSHTDAALVALKYSKVNVILHSHSSLEGTLTLKYKILDVLGRMRLKGKNYFRLACGKKAGLGMFKSQDFKVIENGIDFSKYYYSEENRTAIRTQYHISIEQQVIGHVGRAGVEKNYPFLLESFAKLSQKEKQARLLLIGNIDQDDEVQKIIKDLDLVDKVICTGKVQDVGRYYSAMDVFFFPSLFEGFSVSLVEAQANGLPCVVSERVDCESAISNLVTFISIEDSDKAAEILYNAIYENNIRNNVSLNQKYNIRNSAQKMFNYYRQYQIGDVE